MENKDAEYWIAKGNEFYEAKDYEEAIKCYDVAIQLDPNNATAFYFCGNALRELAPLKKDVSLFERAIERYNQSTQIDPNNDSAFNNCGNALHQLADFQQDVSLFEYAIKNYGIAMALNPNDVSAFYNCGLALCHLAEITQDETLLKRAVEIFDKAIQLDPNNASTFCNYGVALYRLAKFRKDVFLFERAIEKYNKATQLDQSNTNKAKAFNNLGVVLEDLAKIQKNTSLLESAVEKYQKATQLDPNYTQAFDNLEVAYYRLAEYRQDKTRYSESLEYLKNSKQDILSIFADLYRNDKESIFQTQRFYSLLDASNTIDALFFAQNTKSIEKDVARMNEYKDIYLRATFIINLLHINNPSEKVVAHYCEKNTSQTLLLKDDAKLRLNAIDNSNDLSEGKTLLDFLYETEKPSPNENVNTEYEAFAGCFTFDYNNLNQFRLYGKDTNSNEGTGVSLVFWSNFFSKEAKLAVAPLQTFSHKMMVNTSINENNLALFRCIYIDPYPKTKQPIITVGQKEEYLFYREGIGDNFKEYDEEMKWIVARVREEMDKLKEQANKLNPTIVGQLLLHLRYLVKHVAFKEEQECRIVKILHLHDKNIIVEPNFKQMYINYAPSVPMHLEKIFFGPKATGIELFQSMLKNKNLNIPCEQSKNPLA